MSVWRRSRNEVAGAWRSLRYDMGRRPGPAPASAGAAAPDVTSTGMSTFGGVPAGDTGAEHDRYARPPRRVAAVAAFGVLAVTGAAGSYFAVVNGLGALLGGPAAAEPYPLAVAAPPDQPRDEADSISGMGRGSAPRAAATTVVPVPPRTVAAPATGPAPAQAAPPPTEDADPGTPASGEDCDCRTPPVPTPTAPPPPSPTPTAGELPEPEPSDTSPTASDSPSAEPGAGDDESPVSERHSRRNR
jgi:hypothetical protein